MADDILEDQIIDQVGALVSMRRGREFLPARVIPMAIKVIGVSQLYVAQYAVIDVTAQRLPDALTLESESIMTLVPVFNTNRMVEDAARHSGSVRQGHNEGCRPRATDPRRVARRSD